VLLLTHLHIDHVGGIRGVFAGRDVGQVLTGPLLEPATGLGALRDALVAAGRPPTAFAVVAQGARLSAGSVQIEVIAPARAMRGTRSDPNNSSLVLRVTIDGLRILLGGDSEVEEQRAMLASGAALQADVLKVPHHGSAHVDSDWFDAVGAGTAIISVGAGNDYGLPAPSLLDMLRDSGAQVLRTDERSDVAVAGVAGRWTVAWRGRALVDAAANRARAPPARARGHGAAARAWAALSGRTASG
jgi:competence protein ComEC